MDEQHSNEDIVALQQKLEELKRQNKELEDVVMLQQKSSELKQQNEELEDTAALQQKLERLKQQNKELKNTVKSISNKYNNIYAKNKENFLDDNGNPFNPDLKDKIKDDLSAAKEMMAIIIMMFFVTTILLVILFRFKDDRHNRFHNVNINEIILDFKPD